MLRLSFLSRVAFICNISLVLSALLRYIPFDPMGADSLTGVIISMFTTTIAGLILGMGLLVSFIMNPIVNIWYGVVLIRRQPLRTKVPVWLAISNFIFLILQLYMII